MKHRSCTLSRFREISNAFSSDAGDQTMGNDHSTMGPISLDMVRCKCQGLIFMFSAHAARIIVRLQQMMELEDMLRHILKSVPGFRPLEASQAKVKDMARGGHFGSSSIVIESSAMSSLAKKDTWTMDIDNDPKPCFAHSNEVVSFESLTPYLRELEVFERRFLKDTLLSTVILTLSHCTGCVVG